MFFAPCLAFFADFFVSVPETALSTLIYFDIVLFFVFCHSIVWKELSLDHLFNDMLIKGNVKYTLHFICG